MHLETATWRGVMPAITTPFDASGEIDHAFLESVTTSTVLV